MKIGLLVLALCSAIALGQASQKGKSLLPPKPDMAKCVANTSTTIPTKVLNQYSMNGPNSSPGSGPDNLINVYSDGNVDVYTDQTVINWYIHYPAPFTGEFSGPFYFVFRDEVQRQTIIKRIRNIRPEYFNRKLACPDFDPRQVQDCGSGGPPRNPDFLKYIALDITYSTHGPGNVLLPPGATMPSRLFMIGDALYLSSPRCAGLSEFDKRVARQIAPDEEYIDALSGEIPNSTLIGEGEFMALFGDSMPKISRTVLSGDYQVDEADDSLLSRSLKGVALKITEGRRK